MRVDGYPVCFKRFGYFNLCNTNGWSLLKIKKEEKVNGDNLGKIHHKKIRFYCDESIYLKPSDYFF
jgi:hypothetical protein